jgi:VCBS repeat-containing protein
MSNKLSISAKIYSVLILSIFIFSCSKKDSNPTPADPCAGKTVVITPTVVDDMGCGTGSITVAAAGSTGFTYKLNSSGTYQSPAVFNNVAAGTYTVFVKDGDGCEKSISVTVNSTGTAGPLFTAVKDLITSKCVTCHNNTNSQGNMNWTIDCNIVLHQSNIKNRAVDLGTMPPTGPLSQAEKDIITDWIDAGGNYAD